MELISALLLAAAVSVDGFGAGVAFGLRKIKMPLMSVVVVSLASGISLYGAMMAGGWLAAYIPFAQQAGAVLLIGFGLWLVYQNLRTPRTPQGDSKTQGPSTVLALHLRPLGIIVHIMREPVEADRDRSGLLSCGEAILLGTALAMDAMAAGFGAAMAGLSPTLMTPLVILTKFCFLTTGLTVGNNWISTWGSRPILVILPGLILAGLGTLWLL
ncbi:MAG: sporulation membrane protein YtaF [Limnochordia bacterium]